MTLLDKYKEYEYSFIFFDLFFYNILIFIFIFLKMPFVALYIFYCTIPNYMEREDLWKDNWSEEDDQYPSFCDEEDIIEDNVDEILNVKLNTYIYSEFVEFWDYTKHLIPIESCDVDLKYSFENLDLMYKYKFLEPKIKKVDSYSEVQEFEKDFDERSCLSQFTLLKTNLIVKF